MPNSQISTPAALRSILLTLLFAPLAVRAHAQLPVDSDTWKARCLYLNTNAAAIDKGSATPELLAITHGITADKFAAVAHERSNAGQHYIACTLYYAAAMADHMGNGGKINPGRAHGFINSGDIEEKRASGQSLPFKEKMDSAGKKVGGSMKSSNISPVDVAAVFAAFSDPADVAAPPAAPKALPPPPPGLFPGKHQ